MTVEDLKKIAFSDAEDAAMSLKKAREAQDDRSEIYYKAIIDASMKWLARFENLRD